MKIERNVVLSMTILMLITACADPQPENGKSPTIKSPAVVSKSAPEFKSKPKIVICNKKPVSSGKYDQRAIDNKKEQVLSSIDEGIHIIDSELNKNNHYN